MKDIEETGKFKGIRSAQLSDLSRISDLLQQLEYAHTENFLKDKFIRMSVHPDEELLVYEENGGVKAFLSLHFIPQIALEGDFARISYFAVEQRERSRGIGKKMEKYCIKLAMERGCDRIELHSHFRREQAHKFYFREGYVESPKYLVKLLKQKN